jgi:hypothetical protein
MDTVTERETPKVGEIYKHFKGTYYEIIAIAKHTETLGDMVVYRAVGKPYNNTWVRPLNNFMSAVDKKKYPNVEQEYRFELC